MENKNGFTLIELLAVIIILSVVVVITVPVVSNSIENSKRSSAIESANSLIQSAEYYFLTASPKYGRIDVLNDKLNYKGEKPDLGEIEIDRQGKSRIYTYVNGYCVTKEFGTELYANKMNKENCSWFGTDNYETTEGTTFTLNDKSIKNYLIYGNSTQTTRSGKNLLNKANFTTSFTSTYYKDETTGFKLTAEKTYTLSFNYKVNSATATLYTGVGYGTTKYSADIISSKQYPNQTSGRQTVTFTTPTSLADGNYLFIRFARTSTSSSASVDISSVQLEEGSSATAYEEYGLMPSPEYPSEVKSTGDLLTSSNCASYGSDACNNIGKYVVQVKNRGKNLFNVDDFISTFNSYKASDYQTIKTSFGGYDCIKVYGTLSVDGRNVQYLKNQFKDNTQYTFSLDIYDVSGGANNYVGISGVIEYTDGTSDVFVSSSRNFDEWKTVTLTSKANKTVSYIRFSYGTGSAYSYIKNWQIEEGTSVTSYESYKEKITNIYLTEPLRKVGDYADYIDFNNKKVVRNVKEYTLTGNELIWNYGSAETYNSYQVLPSQVEDRDILNKNNIGSFNTHFPSVTSYANLYYGKVLASYTGNINTSYGSIILGTNITTSDELKTWLASNKPKVYYVLENAKEEKIDLPNVESLDGYSTLFINTNIRPSKVILTTNK